MKTPFYRPLLSTLLAISLTACEGNSSGTKSPPTNPPPTEEQASTGVFTDSPVAGVKYASATQEGTTNVEGEFEYVDGEEVIFSIGGIHFPAVSGKGRVTPLDMGGDDANLETPAVVNILRLLQTLDEDGDPENGITVTAATATAMQDVALDFSAASFESEATTAINAQLQRELVSETDAVAHFEGALKDDLLGSWVFEEGGGNVNVLTFLDSSTYVIAHSMADDGDQTAGSVEYGTYTWNPVTAKFSITGVIEESDGSGGLYNSNEPTANQNITASLSEGSLTLGLGDETVTFMAVESSDNPLLGAWYLGEPDIDNHNVLTFLSNTDYVIVHTNNTESYDGATPIAASSEWNTYTWSETTGAFSLGDATVETDGDGGLYNKDGINTITALSVEPNGDLEVTEDDETFEFSRIGRFSVALQDRDGDTETALVKRDVSRFLGTTSGTWSFPDIGAGETGEFDIGTDAYNSLELESDGTGFIHFPPSEDNDFAEDDSNTVTWFVSASGVLHVIDDGYEGYRTYTPLQSKSGMSVLMRTFIQNENVLGEAFIVKFAPVLELDLIMTNTLTTYEAGEVFSHDGGGATMQCHFEMAVGEEEVYAEKWVLNANPDLESYLIWEEDGEMIKESVTYDAETGTVTHIGVDPLTVVSDVGCADCAVTYYTESTWSWTATFDEERTPIISGDIADDRSLTWNLDDSVSVCSGTYEMEAELAPAIL